MSEEIEKSEAKKRVDEMNRGLGEILLNSKNSKGLGKSMTFQNEKKEGKIEIPIPRNVVKKGIKKVVSILKKMVEEDTDEYREIGDKKIGNVRVQHGLRVRFLDEDKKDSKKG